MAEFLVIFLTSLAVAMLLVVSQGLHGRWTGDFQGSGVQKHHHGNPARVGLLSLLAGSLVAIWLFNQSAGPVSLDAGGVLLLLLVCVAPAALFGLLEDVTKRVRARWRLLGPMIGVALGAVLLNAVVPRVGIPGLDQLVAWWPIGLGITLLMLVGFTHAMNIVDGLNGLASGLVVMMLGATAYAAHLANDAALMYVCGALAAATLGFMAVNYPKGLMFLGDGGAYFLGFILAQLWVLLLVRDSIAISPWFVVAVAFHPTMETIFSILRRKLRTRKRNATAPDRLHLHSLIYRRRMRPLLINRFPAQPWAANAAAAAAIWVMAGVPMVLACLAPASSLWNAAVFAVSACLYWLQFRNMVAFRGMPGRGLLNLHAAERRPSNPVSILEAPNN